MSQSTKLTKSTRHRNIDCDELIVYPDNQG